MLVVVALAGAAVEVVASRSDAARYPAPGRLVEVAGADLHLLCTGTGSPTVLLEAGLGEPALTWADVQQPVDDDLRVCSHDRAGLGWSSPGETQWTAEGAAAELTHLLDAADEPGPYVLVAHSIGALVAREFRQAHPDRVAAMILLDPTDEEAVLAAGVPTAAVVERHVHGLLVRTGLMRRLGSRLVPAVVGAVPPDDLLRRLPAVYGGRAVDASLRELRGTVASAEHLTQTEDRDWGELPVTVVSAATRTTADVTVHAALAARSDRGRHVTAPRGGHYVHYDDPDLVVRLVADAVAGLR